MRNWLLVLGVIIGAVAWAPAGEVGAQGGRPSFRASRDCIQPIYLAPTRNGDRRVDWEDWMVSASLLGDIARECDAWAKGPRNGGVGAARARFYAGRANRILNRIPEAIGQLEGAVALGSDYRDFSSDERRVATLELIHAYWQAGPDRIGDAQSRLELGLRQGVLSSNNAAVAYQQAMLQLAREGIPARPAAFRLLATWFPGDQNGLRASGLSDEDIRSARSWLFRLGSDLGRATLVEVRDPIQRRERARDGVNYFDAAARTAQIACPLPRSASDACNRIRAPEAPANALEVVAGQTDTNTEIADVLFGLGVSHLRAAGAPDSDPTQLNAPGGLDCLNGIRPDAIADINAAASAFEAIGAYSNSANARQKMRWGQGCSELAGLLTTSPAGATARLQRAIEYLSDPAPTSVNMRLTLAAAYVRQNDRGRAQAQLRAALSDPGFVDDRQRAAINVEYARTYYYTTPERPVIPDLFTRAVTDIQNASLNELRQSDVRAHLTEAGNNAEARLVLAHIDMRQAETSGQWQAACNGIQQVVRADLAEDRGVGVGPYLWSRCLTMQRQAAYATERMTASRTRSNQAEAVRQAINAYQKRNSHSEEYRRQACEAQIAFGDTRTDEYCSAGASADGQALLYQGMYWLRRGMGERGDARSGSYTKAMQAFVDGSDSVGALTFVDLRNQQAQQIPLNNLHAYGRNYVEYCVGLRYTDVSRNANMNNPDVPRLAFIQFGMPRC